jgi:hypothetical protein
MSIPHPCDVNCDSPNAKMMAVALANQVDAVEADMKSAHVVRLPYADHYLFRSNESEVLHEMNAFIDGLRH